MPEAGLLASGDMPTTISIHHKFVRLPATTVRLTTSHAARRATPTLIRMAPNNLPAAFAPTSQDIEMLLAAQCHLGSKNLQVHMEPYLWKTRPDGINVLNIGKTW